MADSYRDLVAWQKSMQLATALHRASGRFPKIETYALTVQLRRCAYSVPSNIAEGKGRDSKKEFVMFLYRARGSLCEAQTQVEIARNLDYISDDQFATLNEQCVEVGKVLNGLIRSLERQLDASA
jgi:four helix bundle protein